MELNMELLQPLDLINNCLITLPNTDGFVAQIDER